MYVQNISFQKSLIVVFTRQRNSCFTSIWAPLTHRECERLCPTGQCEAAWKSEVTLLVNGALLFWGWEWVTAQMNKHHGFLLTSVGETESECAASAETETLCWIVVVKWDHWIKVTADDSQHFPLCEISRAPVIPVEYWQIINSSKFKQLECFVSRCLYCVDIYVEMLT